MEQISLTGIKLDFDKTGNGPPLLYLHSEHYFHLQASFIKRLSENWTVYVPRHPGFDGRQPPPEFRRIDDLTYLYLDLIDNLALDEITLLGSSFGGWIALEIAVRNCSRLGALCLLSPVGAKLSDCAERDFADLWTFSEEDSAAALFAQKAPNFKDFNDDEMTATARDRQFVAYYGWKPYLHSLSLARWLHRISVPAHLIWGAGDGFTTPEYGKKLSKLIPDATLDILPNAGHYPQLEQLEKTIETILAGPCGNRQIGRVA